MIAIVSYGAGNPASILNMLRKIGAEAVVTSDPGQVAAADKLILPGVGAFDAGMAQLETSGLIPVLTERVCSKRVPTLGICLGLQLFGRESEEGMRPGLGWLAARTVRLDVRDSGLKVPHMGWAELSVLRSCPLLVDVPDVPRYYFAHSYHLACDDPSDVVATARHGRDFPAIVWRGQLFGTQFHPEKSHRFGLALLRSFASLKRAGAATAERGDATN